MYSVCVSGWGMGCCVFVSGDGGGGGCGGWGGGGRGGGGGGSREHVLILLVKLHVCMDNKGVGPCGLLQRTVGRKASHF